MFHEHYFFLNNRHQITININIKLENNLLNGKRLNVYIIEFGKIFLFVYIVYLI